MAIIQLVIVVYAHCIIETHFSSARVDRPLMTIIGIINNNACRVICGLVIRVIP